ncbi:MAG TPA: SGNH/GDSL hydrolase family protein [Acetobacteraceae bacterium]|nr:SGNH/GDSL hydrolase family protein [Acetobacteraceae bacterium]
MKTHLALALFCLAPLAVLTAADVPAPTANPTWTTVSVDSPAFVFSPGNWIGDEGRGGKVFRQAWNAGAYFRVAWKSKNAVPAAKLLLDVSTYTSTFKPPKLAYSIDGVWKSNVDCANEIPIDDLKGAGDHELDVVVQSSEQKERWGSPGQSPLNVVRIAGLQVDADSQPVPDKARPRWALIIGDSITEGIGATELACYSHLLGQALLTVGCEYGLSACGWNGWIFKGDNPPGDVPGYYNMREGSAAGSYEYDDATSRWNKIDGNNHSLLDAHGHISAYGGTGQEPALIFFNYGTNDAIHHADHGQTVASINQGLAAVRAAAPEAEIIVLVPFGQYYVSELKAAVEIRRNGPAKDRKIDVIDLGPGVAKNLAVKKGLMGGLHPNDRGNANFAAEIIPQVIRRLPFSSQP